MAENQCSRQNELSPLHTAALNGNLQEVQTLLSAGHDVNSVCTNAMYRYWTPLLCAAWEGHYDVVQLLVKKGANLDFQNSRGFTALNAAIWRFREDIATYLLERGANPNLHSVEGYTPLMSACLKSSYELIALLLKSGADVNRVQDGGWTALHAAAERSDVRILVALVENGANLREFGVGALEVARQRGNVEGVAYLERVMGVEAIPSVPEEQHQ